MLTGNFNKTAQSALIREIKTVEVKMNPLSSACIMKCIFQYAKSGREQFLEGTFTSIVEKNGLGGNVGGDCGGGKVYLRKVPTSDFYIEPFLRNDIKTNAPDSTKIPPTNNKSTVVKKKIPITKKPVKKIIPLIVKKSPVKKKTVPLAKKPVKKTSPAIVKKTIPTKKTQVIPKTNPITIKTKAPAKLDIDSVKSINNSLVTEQPTKEIFPVPDVLKSRENALVKTLVVHNQTVLISLYDNGVVDGDSISVYFDNKLVLDSKGLSEKPLTIKLKLEDDNAEHELVMVALNEGRIPPNTSLMIVECGDQRFDVHITSTEQRNAVVRFKYHKSPLP